MSKRLMFKSINRFSFAFPGAFLLRRQIINRSGIPKAKSGAWISEMLRAAATAFAVIVFNGIYQPSALLRGISAIAVFCIFRMLAYFRPNGAKSATA